ncbi:hypothetical protein Tco_0820897 [Tanacetum coccineum]|uniref:Uncharacterized protein n=1 Tax=Tanacetum coccineum TaxID=301880 RepID=A0ABQ5AEU0_9ASTR
MYKISVIKTVTVPGTQTTPATVKDRTYDELTDAEKLHESCDIKATNIVRELKLYDEFDLFTSVPGKTIHSYYLRFAQLLNDIYTIGMTIRPIQVNTKFINHLQPELSKFVMDVKIDKDLHGTNFDQLYAYLRQQEAHEIKVRIMKERFLTPLALVANTPNSSPFYSNQTQPRNSAWFKEKAMLADALESGMEIPTLAAFQTDDLDAFNFDCDEAPSASAVLMAKLSSYDSKILSAVPIHDYYIDNHVMDPNVQETRYFEQLVFDNDTDIDITSDINMISYDQYLKETKNTIVQDTSSSAQQEAMIMSVIEEMNNQVAKCNKVDKENKMINESLTAELERYKEQIIFFEERQKFDLNDREKYIDSQLRNVIVDKNAKVADFENQIHSLKQLNATVQSHKTLSTMVDVLKKESKAKEDKYLKEIIGLEKKNKALDNVVYKMGQSTQTMHIAFWGADDEEISEGGIPRVIVLGYDGLPIQPVAPPSPDYIPGPEDPQTPPVPQDEDEREPMFVQAHDPDYVPEPIYPEYIPLEDEHEFPAEEQPLPPVDSPTAESPGYVTKSDPEEDPEEYEDDETEDGPVDYPMDGGDDGDDDDGDSSRDDTNDEDEDDEEEEHLAPADSTIVVPVDEPIFPPEGTEPVIPPPSTDITIGARITVRPQTSISLPPEAEVERLLAMTTPSPSPPISLSPPSAGERLARSTAPPAHLSPLPPLPPSLYIPPPVDYRDKIPESEQPPRKRLCLSTLGSRYEVEESSTARPTRGRGIDYGFVSTVDAEERRQGIRDVGYGIRDTWVDPAEAVPKIAPITVIEVNTRVTELAKLHKHDTQDLYALLEDAQDSRSRISQRVNMDSQRVDLLMGDRMTLQETVWMVEEEAYASREAWAHSIRLSQATHQELQTYRDHVYAYETHLLAHQTQLQLQGTLIQTQHQDQMVETLRVIRDMRREMSDMQTELLALRGQQRRARQPGLGARIPDHPDASGDADSHI